MDLALRLRAATAELHERIERLPAAQAMVAGKIGRAAYLAVLGQLARVHEVLERELEMHASLRAVYQPRMARLPVLHADLAILGGHAEDSPWQATVPLLQEIQGWSAHRPWALLGSLYILEGSRMGSLVLAKPLSMALGVPLQPGHGLDYHLQGMAERPRAWQQFKAALEAVPLTAEQADQVVAAAVQTMAGLHALYASASPPRAALVPAANFPAGAPPLPVHVLEAAHS